MNINELYEKYMMEEKEKKESKKRKDGDEDKFVDDGKGLIITKYKEEKK